MHKYFLTATPSFPIHLSTLQQTSWDSVGATERKWAYRKTCKRGQSIVRGNRSGNLSFNSSERLVVSANGDCLFWDMFIPLNKCQMSNRLWKLKLARESDPLRCKQVRSGQNKTTHLTALFQLLCSQILVVLAEPDPASLLTHSPHPHFYFVGVGWGKWSCKFHMPMFLLAAVFFSPGHMAGKAAPILRWCTLSHREWCRALGIPCTYLYFLKIHVLY